MLQSDSFSQYVKIFLFCNLHKSWLPLNQERIDNSGPWSTVTVYHGQSVLPCLSTLKGRPTKLLPFPSFRCSRGDQQNSFLSLPFLHSREGWQNFPFLYFYVSSTPAQTVPLHACHNTSPPLTSPYWPTQCVPLPDLPPPANLLSDCQRDKVKRSFIVGWRYYL